MHAAPFCRLRRADTIDHGPGLCSPFSLVPQMSQRRFRQGVERAPAGLAAIAWQIRRLTPTHNIAAITMGAADAIHAPLPKFSHAFRCNWVRCQRGWRRYCDRPFAGGRQVDACHHQISNTSASSTGLSDASERARACHVRRRWGKVSDAIQPSQGSKSATSMHVSSRQTVPS